MTDKVRTSRLAEVNSEWWLLLSLLVIAALLTSVGSVNEMLLFLFVLPTLFSAYLFGRRHATLTAIASVFLVLAGTFTRDALMLHDLQFTALARRWWEIAVWGAILVLTGYATGTLFRETHQTHDGILLILRNLMTRDAEVHDSLRRLSNYACAIAEEMQFTREQLELVRATALVHDISRLELDPEVLRKVQRLAQKSPEAMSDKSLRLLQRVLPIIIAAQSNVPLDRIPMEARIIAVAEEFDLTITAGERRSALPASVAKNVIERAAGVKFDAEVVAAFVRAYDQGKLVPRVDPSRSRPEGLPGERQPAGLSPEGT